MNPKRILSAYYFITLAGMGAYYTFLAVYLETDLSLTGTQIGTVFAVAPLIALFASPLFGMLSDILKKPKLILISLLLASSVFLLLVNTFTGMISIYLILAFEFFRAPLRPLTDSYIIKLSKHHNFYFSQVRPWGSFGYIVGSILIGYLINESIGIIFTFTGIVYLLGAIMFSRVPVIKQSKEQNSFMMNLKNLTGRVDFLLLVLIVSSTYAVSKTMNSFNGIRIIELGGNFSHIGYATFALALFEIVLLRYNYRLLRKLGVVKMFLIGSIALTLRWFLHYVSDDVWVYIVSTALHGISFSFVFPTALIYIGSQFPDEINATAYSLVNAFFLITLSIFGFLFGRMYEVYSFDLIYLILIGLGIGTLGTIYLFSRYTRIKKH